MPNFNLAYGTGSGKKCISSDYMKSKIIILLIGVATFLIACKNCECTSENIRTMDDTTFNSLFERLDIKEFEKNDEYYEKYNDITVKVQITRFERGYTHYISIDRLNYISIHKTYYSDGKIKDKGLYNDLGFPVGKWYEFNELGKLTEVIDTDKNYNFTFQQLKEELSFEEKLSFDNLKARNSGNWGNEYSIKIRRFSEPDPRWYVTYSDTTNSANGAWGTNIEIVYNGKTGERISKEFIPIM